MPKNQGLPDEPPCEPYGIGYFLEVEEEEITIVTDSGEVIEEDILFVEYGEIDAPYCTYGPLEEFEQIEDIQDIEDWYRDVADEPPSQMEQEVVKEPAATRLQRPPSVSVIVTARNHGRFLRACLHSVLAQTVPASEVTYVDDGSDDDSLAIARQFEPFGVKVLALPHQGVVKARNRGAETSRGDALLFVDGDNMLSPDYIALHRAALTRGAVFAYGSLLHFGTQKGVLSPPPFHRETLWMGNFADTSSMVQRIWFEAAGGWRENPSGSLWDWDLWLRVSRFGPGARVPSNLHYRRHDANWSLNYERRPSGNNGELFGKARRGAARLAVVTVLCGRLPGLFPAWLDALAESLQGWEGDPPELVVMDDTPQGFWKLARPCLDTLEATFRDLKVIRIHQGRSAVDRRLDRGATSRFLTSAYQTANEATSADVIWYVEDDVVVPPSAADRLSRSLLDGHRPRPAVAGLYRSRHEPCFVLSRLEGDRVEHATEVPPEPGPCDLTGTGCLMVFRPLIKARFQPDWHVPGTRYVVPAHDWAFSWQMREDGHPIWVEPTVLCRHHVNETEWV